MITTSKSFYKELPNNYKKVPLDYKAKIAISLFYYKAYGINLKALELDLIAS